MKTKDLSLTTTPQVAEKQGGTVFDAVVVEDTEGGGSAPSNKRERFFLKLGALRSSRVALTLMAAQWAEYLDDIKRSGEHKSAGYTWEQFIVTETPYGSVDTVDRIISDFREFGRGIFILREFVRVSRAAYRLVNPEVDEKGNLIIGGATFEAKKSNTAAIQHAFQVEREKRLAAERRTASVERASVAAEEERKKAQEKATELAREVTRLNERVRELQNPEPTPIKKKLASAQALIARACELIEDVWNHPDLRKGDECQIAAVAEYAIKLIVETSGHDPLAIAAMKNFNPEPPDPAVLGIDPETLQ